jgi:hypothetical protein
VPAGELRPGDLLVSHDGRRVAVTELYNTGQYERVYNLAIRSFHTYFVCDETWPCSVWAHNACRIAPDPDAKGPHTVIRRNPQTGQTIRYATYIPQTNPRNPAKWQLVKRVDLVGDEHYNKVLKQYIPVPHVHDPSFPGGIRPALPEELPLK